MLPIKDIIKETPLVDMNISTNLCCPNCHSARLRDAVDSVLCEQCEHSYLVMFGIIDFREATIDATANFSIETDRILAGQLALAFPFLKTFNELYALFLLLRTRQSAGDDITGIDLGRMVLEQNILPRPMSEEQLIHGRAILDKVYQHIKSTSYQGPSRGSALENGGGLGFFIDGFSKHFENVTVLDFSLAYLVLAKKIVEERNLSNVLLICGSVERLPFRSNSFDFIHSNNVIEHVTNQKAMFAEAKRVVNATGLFFVLSPNRFSVYFEPHFRLPLFGFIPVPIRRKLIQVRQRRDIDEISLRSLNELRALALPHFGENTYVSFIPRYMNSTVTGGTIRDSIVWCLNSRVLGAPMNLIVNKIFLGIMPYHVMLCFEHPKLLK